MIWKNKNNITNVVQETCWKIYLLKSLEDKNRWLCLIQIYMVAMLERIVAKLVTAFLKNGDTINRWSLLLAKQCFRDMILFRVLSYPQVPSSSRLVLMQIPVICSTFININIYLMFRAPKRKKNLHFEIPACTGTGITFYFSCK